MNTIETRPRALFGPGGNGEEFHRAGKKSTLQAPAWLRETGLDAFEYEAGNGIAGGEQTLRAIGEEARRADIAMSLHAPYFISLASADPEKRRKSILYIQESLQAAVWLGAHTVVVHMGGVAKMERAEGMRLSADTLYKLLSDLPDTPVRIGLETMGKKNQLGTLDEVLSLCRMDPRLVPVVDLGHLNARELGGVFQTADDYTRLFSRIAEQLGDHVARTLHCHFSHVEWTGAGEKRHLTFADTLYGPYHELFCQALARDGLCPTVICESAGTQSEDARAMKAAYCAAL